MSVVREHVVRLACAIDPDWVTNDGQITFRDGGPLTTFEAKLLRTATVAELEAAQDRMKAAISAYGALLAEFTELKGQAFDGVPSDTPLAEIEPSGVTRRLFEVYQLMTASPVEGWETSGRDSLDRWAAS